MGLSRIPKRVESRVRSLASQAAVAIENNRLYESIETLFEGFVKASVSAIEARDPATSGHSFRVADMTLRLAEMVDRDDSPSFREVRFGRAEMQEIRYASLLHDFGKVGVREEVLVKAKKLYPGQLELVKQRFAFVRKAREHEQSERKLRYLLEKGGRNSWRARRIFSASSMRSCASSMNSLFSSPIAMSPRFCAKEISRGSSSWPSGSSSTRRGKCVRC